jgi:hypothetical protein
MGMGVLRQGLSRNTFPQAATGSARTSYLHISGAPEASSTWHGEDTAERVHTLDLVQGSTWYNFKLLDKRLLLARLSC